MQRDVTSVTAAARPADASAITYESNGEHEDKDEDQDGRDAHGNRDPYFNEEDAFDSDAEYDFDPDWADPEVTNDPPSLQPHNTSTTNRMRTENHRVGSKRPRSSSGTDTSCKRPASDASQRTYKVVSVPDVAPRTYRALLRYLYTDRVGQFAPLTSEFITMTEYDLFKPIIGSPYFPLPSESGAADVATSSSFAPSAAVRARVNGLGILYRAHIYRLQAIEDLVYTGLATVTDVNPNDTVSAKYLFRLADRLNLPILRRLAKNHIMERLNVNNVV